MRRDTLRDLLRLAGSQECARDNAFPDPAKVGACDLAANLASRELEERPGKVLDLVDSTVILLQLAKGLLEGVSFVEGATTRRRL